MYSCEAVYIHVAHHPLEGLVVCVVGLDAWAELERPELLVAGVVRDSVTSGVGCSPLPWPCRPERPGMGGAEQLVQRGIVLTRSGGLGRPLASPGGLHRGGGGETREGRPAGPWPIPGEGHGSRGVTPSGGPVSGPRLWPRPIRSLGRLPR